MNIIHNPWTKTLLTVALFLAHFTLFAQSDKPTELNKKNYEKEWKSILELENKGRYRSALEEVDKLLEQAITDDVPVQQLKALLFKGKYTVELEEEGYVAVITELEGRLKKATFPTNAMLQSILAQVYQQYMMDNLWQIQNRTDRTESTLPDDIRTWDVSDFEERISALYLVSVSHEGLKDIEIDAIRALLVEQEEVDHVRPTLYDFLTHRALSHFTNEASYLTTPVYAYQLEKEEAFAPAAVFANANFLAKDVNARTYKAIQLFQQLTAFRLAEKDVSALVDLELQRIEFAHLKSVHPDKDALYRKALLQLEKDYEENERVAVAAYYRARTLRNEGNAYKAHEGDAHRWKLTEARDLCEATIKKYPDARGAILCENLLSEIQSKSLTVRLEEVLSPERPALMQLQFRNVETAYFRLAKISESDRKKLDELDYKERMEFLRKLPVVNRWETDLPLAGDLQSHITETALGTPDYGYYVLFFSDNKSFDTDRNKNDQSHLFFYVSDIGYFSRIDEEGHREFVVASRTTGKPMANVEVVFYSRTYDYDKERYRYKEVGKDRTDKDGRVTAQLEDRDFQAGFRKGEDILYPPDNYYTYKRDQSEKESQQTVIFTDRAIYRPGQTLYFKGLAISKLGKNTKILAGEEVKVTLYDPNMQAVDTQTFTTNEFGTFEGSMELPTSGVRGQFNLRTSGINGGYGFRVEEYKRPKFEVAVNMPDQAYELNDEITVTGNAKAFAGYTIDGAKVQYRVTREVRLPWRPWGWYARPAFNSGTMEMTNGETTTDAEGTFTFDFTALPEPTIDKKYKPYFSYTVKVEVTDINGETQVAKQTINVGYVSLLLEADVPAKLDKSTGEQELSILGKDLNQTLQSTAGKVELIRLQSPEQIFIKRYWERPDTHLLAEKAFRETFPHYAHEGEDMGRNWPQLETVYSEAFSTTPEAATLALPVTEWETGHYLLRITSTDKKGELVELEKPIVVFSSSEQKIPANEAFWQQLKDETVEPGEVAQLQLATAEEELFVLLEIERDREILESKWMTLAQWETYQHTVTEADRGNFYFHLSFIKNNRSYNYTQKVNVPWTNKELTFEYSSFRDKLRPGAEEEWRIKILGPKKERVAAEMVAALYDASLDQFVSHSWHSTFYPLNNHALFDWREVRFNQVATGFHYGEGGRSVPYLQYERLRGFGFLGRGAATRYYSDGIELAEYSMMRSRSAPAMEADMAAAPVAKSADVPPPPPPPLEEAANVAYTEDSVASPAVPAVRTNLDETVFFMPDLYTDEEGNVEIRFTMNEALTRWKFMAFAHTKDLKYGFSNKEVVTQKELMVQPNAPRFVREGDEITFTAKVVNLTENELTGTAELQLFDAISGERVDELLGLANNQLRFTAAANQSDRLAWKLSIPNGLLNTLTHRVVAQAGNYSDGEESALPVLTNRMLVTETLPLFVRSGKTKTFTLESFKQAGASESLVPHNLQLEFTSNPAWLAVKALPYLMEYPHDCSEQIFSRYYANTLAASVVNQHPKIKEVFAQWEGTDALDSELMKNQELKTVLLEETPWVLQAQSEAEQRKQIAVLFDLDRMAKEQQASLHKLRDRQEPSGGWSWFPGGRENWFITQHIVAGMGHLNTLNVKDGLKEAGADKMLERAIGFIDREMAKYYQKLQEQADKGYIKLKDDHLSSMAIHYLYTRSFFQGYEIPKKTLEAVDYFLEQAAEYWLDKNLYGQAQLALATARFEVADLPDEIIVSLSERAIRSEEMGAYFKYPRGYFYHQAPVETHSLMIELFNEVAEDAEMVEELKIWLLKNKQTTHWKTTKATAEAVYVLLNTGRGGQMLLDENQVELTFTEVNKRKYEDKLTAAQSSPEAGTGYFSVDWRGEDIEQDMHTVKVRNKGTNIAWGGLYWQYFEDIDKVKTFEETPLTLKKQLYREIKTDTGLKLEPLDENAPVTVGDRLIVRLELRSDRDMEYLHMKDLRASGLEPENVLSQYKWQEGLGYYESTGDAATHFFISYLPKGTYVFEYPLRVAHAGDFSNGMTSIQCMYAPEFSSHSAGDRLEVAE